MLGSNQKIDKKKRKFHNHKPTDKLIYNFTNDMTGTL